MNIFYTDTCPVKSAQALCDKHVVKMPLESAQMLCTAHRVLALGTTADGYPIDYGDSELRFDKLGMYKSTHYNHPSSVWTRKSFHNYKWLFNHYLALCLEYQYRYTRVHKCFQLAEDLNKVPKQLSNHSPSEVFEPPPACMPDEYKISNDVTKCYKLYLQKEKASFSKWSTRHAPVWWGSVSP